MQNMTCSRRFLEHSNAPEHTKGIGRPSYSILQLKEQYEKILSGEWGVEYCEGISKDDKQALMKLFDALIKEEKDNS